MTDPDGIKPLTVYFGDGRRTVRFNLQLELHRKAWDGLCRMRAQHPTDSDSEQVKRAVKWAARRGEGTCREVIQTLQTEWTQTEEPLSEACVIRECLRRAGQQVERVRSAETDTVGNGGDES